MKKLMIIFIASLAMVSCNGGIKSFATKFLKAINDNDKIAVASMYPTAQRFDVMCPDGTELEKVEVVNDENGHKIVQIGKIRLDVYKDDIGSLKVADSWGLLDMPEDLRYFATSTGWLDVNKTDRENAVALQDEGFKKYILNNLQTRLHLSAKISTKTDYSAWCTTTYLVLTNNTDADIPGELFNVVVKCDELSGEEFDAYGEFMGYGTKTSHKTIGGIDVPAHGTAKKVIDESDYEYGPSFSRPSVKFNKKCDVTKIRYSFTGTEYRDYLATAALR